MPKSRSGSFATTRSATRLARTSRRSVSETVQRSKTESKKLEDRVAALERTDADKQAEWRADLPAAAVTRVTYRPREAHADGQAEANMAQKAQAVTGKLPIPVSILLQWLLAYQFSK